SGGIFFAGSGAFLRALAQFEEPTDALRIDRGAGRLFPLPVLDRQVLGAAVAAALRSFWPSRRPRQISKLTEVQNYLVGDAGSFPEPSLGGWVFLSSCRHLWTWR